MGGGGYFQYALRRRASMTTGGLAIDTLPPPTVPEQNITYTTNTVNQYITVDTDGTDVSLTYDLDGSLTNDGTFEYTYNAENRMIAATPLDPASGLQKVEADYDYLGRRILKKAYTYTAEAWTLDTTTTFLYDGWNVMQETIMPTGASASTVQYVWGLDLSGTLQGAGGIGGLLLRKSDTGTFVYLYDANGNVGQLVNVADGSIAARYTYDPFGVLLMADGPEADSNPYRYSTQYFDTETELVAYIFRYYSARLGRWTSRDPLEELGGINLYVFVGNYPIGYIDYLGLDWLTNLSNFVAGAGDSLSFGLTRQARKGINFLLWGEFSDPSVTTGSTAYIAGEVTEVAIEISLTLGSASLKNIAKQTTRKALQEAAGRRAFRRAHSLVGGFVHHINPIKGHPAMKGVAGGWRYARYPLPFKWAAKGFWNMKWVPTRAAHNAEHLRLMRLESLDRLRESTILIRQAINRVLIYLEQEDICWDSMEVRTEIYGSADVDFFDESSDNISPLSVEVSEENGDYGVWR